MSVDDGEFSDDGPIFPSHPHGDEDAPPPLRLIKHRGSNGTASFDNPRTRIALSLDEELAVNQSIAALAIDPPTFQRDGRLVRVCDDGIEQPKIQALPKASLRERLTVVAEFVKPGKKGMVQDRPPTWLVDALEARGTWTGIRRLSGVTTAPALRMDGSILDTAGYDAATGLVYRPRASFPPIPAAPTAVQVRDAVVTLCDPLGDFPFRDPADRAAAIAVVLSLVGRPAIDGQVPLFGTRATTAGTGKGLLNDVVTIAATGRTPRMLASTPEDNTEWRKLLVSLAIEGPACVTLDNIEGELGSAALASALTTGEITDRMLGKNETGGGAMRSVWLASGNGLTFRRDLARRVVVIDLEASQENPEDRTGFRYADLRTHVRQIWPALASAALVILRAYCQAGRPAHGKPALGSFEAWDHLVRGALAWSQVGDPDGARARTRDETDNDRDSIRSAIGAWHTAFGNTAVTTAQACKIAESDADLNAALTNMITKGHLTARSLGYALRKMRRKVANGMKFEAVSGHACQLRWYVNGSPVDGMDAIGGDSSLRQDIEDRDLLYGIGADQSPPSNPSPPYEDPSGDGDL